MTAAADKPTGRATFVVRLRVEPHIADGDRALRRALKVILRRFGVRALRRAGAAMTSPAEVKIQSRAWWHVEAKRVGTDWSSLLRQRLRVLQWVRAGRPPLARWARGCER